MFLAHALLAFVVASAFGILLAAALRRSGPWAAPWAAFLVIFLFVWAGGVWVTPIGPSLYHVYWVPFLLMGLFVALLIAAAAEPGRRRVHRPVQEGPGHAEEAETQPGLTVFFWVLIAVLVSVIVAGYL